MKPSVRGESKAARGTDTVDPAEGVDDRHRSVHADPDGRAAIDKTVIESRVQISAGTLGDGSGRQWAGRISGAAAEAVQDFVSLRMDRCCEREDNADGREESFAHVGFSVATHCSTAARR